MADTTPTKSPRPAWFDTIWCIVAAFGVYFCTYGFRKPFTSASYSDITLFGLDGKTAFVIAQVLGYMMSKFIGIKLVSEAKPNRRVPIIIALIAFAELALVLVAVLPAPWSAIGFVLNGLPLGIVFGLILRVLEGRKQTELLTAALCLSFIVADGVTKSVGAQLLQYGVSPTNMPMAAGVVFLVPFLFFCWMLSRVPPPAASDIVDRSERVSMNRAERWAFFRRYAVGLSLLIFCYLLVTVLRSVRADFQPELWAGLGSKPKAEDYSLTELIVGFSVMGLIALTVLLRKHQHALTYSFGLCLLGSVLMIAATLLQFAGLISPFWLIVLIGCGLYLPYIAVHTTIFERFQAVTREPGNIGFLMSVADAYGYLGYVAVLIVKNFLIKSVDAVALTNGFLNATLGIGLALLALLLPAWWLLTYRSGKPK
jgi:hypothetical protein